MMYTANRQLDMTLGLLGGAIRRPIASVDKIEYFETEYKTDNVLPGDEHDWQPLDAGTVLTGYNKHFWIRFSLDTPGVAENEGLYLTVGTSFTRSGWNEFNPQGLLYLNGEIVQGLDIAHTEYKLEPERHYDAYVYFYTSYIDGGAKFTFYADMVAFDRLVEKLYYDMREPYRAALCFDENDSNYAKIMAPLVKACDLLDLCDLSTSSFHASVTTCLEFMQREFYDKLCGKDDIATINCVGHTHIDVAWLWTYAQTREKVQRSFSTVLKLMEQYPEYKFMSSTPQLYQYLKEEAPELYQKVKQAVKAGRWEVEGAMWVEADCNLSSGESFIRQILFGKRFFKEEFDKDSKILWLPDVFGYSAALPQILKKSGVDRFFTSKISWNDTNKMPYDSFIWRGIDGSEIFTFFLTAQELPSDKKPANYCSYVGNIDPRWALGTWNRYQQKEYNDEVILTYGLGDGGGGPCRDMLEVQRRLEKGLPGIPRTRQSHIGEFFDRAEEKFDRACEETGVTPRWDGELYLEFHRGTYTSMAKNKRNNRKAEFALGDLEKLYSFAMVGGAEYPQAQIDRAWETVLLNQFHDVLPGSSIREVYEDSDRMYAQVFDYVYPAFQNLLTSLAQGFETKKGALVYNPNGFTLSDVVTVGGKRYFAQDVPALGFANIELTDEPSSVTVLDGVIENRFYRIVFDSDLNIVSLLDKRNDRELAKKGCVLNQLKMYEDRSYDYDAWELAAYYNKKAVCVNAVSSVESFRDNVGAGLVITREFGKSKLVQKICLYDEIERIDFETYVDWHEEHCILKTEFPLAIPMNKATYEIQFGNLERNTNRNTSWDRAKYEVCAHKWADISDNGYGISLMNDCKYGYSCDGDRLTLSLLKASTYPNPVADRGEHRFTYSLLPHSGNYVEGKTVRRAYALNDPLQAVRVENNHGQPLPGAFVTCDKANVIIETVKKAEMRDSLIVRAYDAENMAVVALLRSAFPVKEAYLCDMMENRLSALEVLDNSVKIPVGNFEIVTIEVVF